MICKLIGHRWWCYNLCTSNMWPGCTAAYKCRRCGTKARGDFPERYELSELPKPSRWYRPLVGRFQ